jgi:hypothetical protein
MSGFLAVIPVRRGSVAMTAATASCSVVTGPAAGDDAGLDADGAADELADPEHAVSTTLVARSQIERRLMHTIDR